MTSTKLPNGVHYTRRNGGMYVRWDGRPEGQVYTTYDRPVAYGGDDNFTCDNPQAGMTTDGWAMTPFQGADGSCCLARVIEMAAKYNR
jgi:hypothetical protein